VIPLGRVLRLTSQILVVVLLLGDQPQNGPHGDAFSVRLRLDHVLDATGDYVAVSVQPGDLITPRENCYRSGLEIVRPHKKNQRANDAARKVQDIYGEEMSFLCIQKEREATCAENSAISNLESNPSASAETAKDCICMLKKREKTPRLGVQRFQ
jgi:hypothetical protein